MIEWRAIPGFDAYEASTEGAIRRRVASAGGRKKAGAVLRGSMQRQTGYHYHTLQTSRGPVRLRTNRLIALAFFGAPPSPAHEAAHKDGNKTNNKMSNLKWATRRQNEDDKIEHGTIRKGESVHLSRITEFDIRYLREEFAKGADIRSLANAMNMTFQNIWYIVHRKTWKHVN